MATDDISGVHYQRIKIVTGPDGTNEGDVSNSNPLPVSAASLTTINTNIAAIEAAVSASAMEVFGTVTVADPVQVSAPALTALDSTVSAGVMFVQPAASNSPLYAVVDVSGSGGVSLVASVSGAQIRVMSVTLVSSVTANVFFAANSAGNPLSGEMLVLPATGFHAAYNPMGHFQTPASTSLFLFSDQNGQLGGFMTYITV